MQCVIVKNTNGTDTAYPILLDEVQALVKKGLAVLDSGIIYREVVPVAKKKRKKKSTYKTKVTTAEDKA